jgi:transcriptional regulator with XRE-family HTH domain
MAISPSSSVRQAREALAQRLREIRLDAGLTARALALAAGWHESKCSRIEHVRTAPSEADIRLWCRICGAGDQAADLIASSRAADSMYTEWRRLEATGLRPLQESLVPLYERTKRFRAYQSHVVPGLFQTPAYAAALLAAISAFRGVPDDSERAAGARAERSPRSAEVACKSVHIPFRVPSRIHSVVSATLCSESQTTWAGDGQVDYQANTKKRAVAPTGEKPGYRVLLPVGCDPATFRLTGGGRRRPWLSSSR